MATVRISKQLLLDVKDEVSAIARNVHAATIKPINPVSNKDMVDEVVEIAMLNIWKDFMHLRNVVPREWLKKVDYVDIKFVGVDEVRIERTSYVPPTMSGYTYVETTLTPEQAPAFYRSLVACNAAESLHKTKFKGIAEKVGSFLSTCKSLKDALNKYPDLALYIPQKYKDQMAVESARAERSVTTHQDEAVLTEEDRDLITSTGVVGAIYKSNS